MTPIDDFDDLAQRLAVALRDHADETRAMPDLDAMRRLLQAAMAGATTNGGGARPSPRVLAAAACSLLVLGGLGLVAATGGRGESASTFVEDETLVAEARRSSMPPATFVEVPATTGVTPPPESTATTVAPSAPSTTVAAAPVSAVLTVAAVSNDLQPAPTTTRPPPTTASALPAPSVPPTTVPAKSPAVKPPSTTTTKPPPSSTTTTIASPTTTVSPFAFTMTQKWKTSSASPPFEEFSGTAQPGATITITSSYGGGTTVVGATGAWALRVEFPTAPVGTAFTGRVKTAQGQKTFTFMRTIA